MSVPTTYTVPSTATYLTADGRDSRNFYAGDVIPMATAIRFGMPGAGYAAQPFFSDAARAALAAELADPESASRAQVEAAIAAAGDPFDLVESVHVDDATAQQTTVAQRAYLSAAWTARAKTVTKLSAYTTATGTNIDLAILDANGTKLAGITAPAASVSNGLATGTLSAPFTYEPGVIYYHCAVQDAATTGLRGVTAINVIANIGTVIRAAYKDVSQNTVPASVAPSWTLTSARIWIAGHN